jgi:hypothetical protein
MKRPLRRLVVASCLAALAVGALSGSGFAGSAATPFYLVPSPTKECQNLSYCKGVAGLWVLVPAHGEATYLLNCPERAKSLGKYLIGGTDARTSSSSVRVWFDGRLGAPIGTPNGRHSIGLPLLFHAVTDNGKPGFFQPILGCVSLLSATKRSTLSAALGSVSPTPRRPAAAPTLRSTDLVLEPGWDRTMIKSCLHNEKLVGSWSAIAFGTAGPPEVPEAGSITVKTAESGDTVSAVVRTSRSVPHLIDIQLGAMCER